MANGLRTSSGVTTTGGQLSDPVLNTFSRQGVVDESSGFLGEAISTGIAKAGQLGLDADEGFAKASLENNIAGFIDSTNPEKVAEKRRGLFSDAEEEFRALQARTTQVGDVADTIDRDAPEYRAIMEKFKTASEQGLLTRDELEIRAREATRKAIARRPGLARELTQHAEQVLNLSGVRDTDIEENLARDEAKRLAEAEKSLKSRATTLGISFDRLNTDIPELNIKVMRIDAENEAFASAERLANMDEATKVANQQIALDNAPKAMFGAVNGLQEDLMKIYEVDPTPANIAAAHKTASMKLIEWKAKAGHAATSLPPSERNAMVARVSAHMESVTEAIRNNNSGEDFADIIGNTSRAMKNAQEVQTMGIMNTYAAGVLSQFGNSIWANYLAETDNVQKEIGSAIGSLLSSGLSPANMNLLLSDNHQIVSGVNNLASGLVAVGQVNTPNANDSHEQTTIKEQNDVFGEALSTVSETLIDNPHGISMERRSNFLTDFTKQFSSSSVADFLNNASPEAKTQVGNLLDQQRIVIANDRDKKIKTAEEAGANVNVRVTPDNIIVYDVTHPTSPAIAREQSNRLNNSVGNRSNELVSAFSLLFGEDKATTMKMLEENNNDFVERRTQSIKSSVGSENFIEKVVEVESGGVTDASPATSAALGVAQFIPRTWESVVDRHSPELRNGRSREEVLELRKDPELSKQMLARLSEDNGNILSRSGIENTDANLYLAHFLGAGIATNVLTEDDATPLEDVVGARAIKANKSIMKGKTVGDLKQWAKGKMGE